jgi:hypothetical protein
MCLCERAQERLGWLLGALYEASASHLAPTEHPILPLVIALAAGCRLCGNS